ncbi:MAG: formylglycine-generating enzyme family protein [Acidobacteriota bacterium]
MRGRLSFLVPTAVLLLAPLAANEPVSKQDLLILLAEGFSESLIVEKIRASGTDIVLTVPTMVELKRAGATDRILRAILESREATASESLPRPTRASDMVLIPAGEYTMGLDGGEEDHSPSHRVYVDAFYIDRYEVTNAEYEKFDPTHVRGPASECDRCPVTNVSWQNAAAYARWAEKRLPTEAEWEKAARGPEGYLFGYGDDYQKHLAHMETDKAVRAGSYPANGYGVFDMLGSVWEWCADYYREDYYAQSPAQNPLGPGAGRGRVVRGGSFRNGQEVNLAVRTWKSSRYRFASIGFRCARDAPGEDP